MESIDSPRTRFSEVPPPEPPDDAPPTLVPSGSPSRGTEEPQTEAHEGPPTIAPGATPLPRRSGASSPSPSPQSPSSSSWSGDSKSSRSPQVAANAWGSRYEVERYHDKGGLGVVWVARDRVLDRAVALKEIRRDWLSYDETRRRFTREAKITGQLSHPGIVQVYDLGERGDDGRPFYVMRFVGGRTLQTVIREYHATKRKTGRPDLVAFRELLGMFVAICRTMAYAHHQKVVHRDLKPANVMIGDYGEVVVLDWGLAKRLSDESDILAEPGDSGASSLSGDIAENLTHGGSVGTPQYMSPEQAEGRHEIIDHLSDIYSLGATLFEILTGEHVWRGDTQIGQLLARIVDEPTPSARSRDNSIPPALDAICAKAMAKRREDRYPKADDLAEDMQRYLAAEPVSSYSEPWFERLGRWTRKHRTLVAAAGVAVVLFAGFAIHRVSERSARGRTLADAVLAADISYVSSLARDLGGYRSSADPILRRAWASENDPQRKLRAGLALLPRDSWLAPDLADLLLRASPDEALVIRGFLINHARDSLETADRLRRVLEDGGASPETRLRAASALTGFMPNDPIWTRHATMIAESLARENPLAMRSWTEAFQPIRNALTLPLAGIFRDEKRTEAERANAAFLVRDYAREPRGLAEVASWAEGEIFELIVKRLAEHGPQAIPHLEAILQRRLKPDWRDQPLASRPAPDSATVKAIEQAQGLTEDRFAFALSLPFDKTSAVCAAMGEAGYRPLKLQPYRAASGDLQAAVTWTRDGRGWRMAWDMDRSAVADWDRRHQAAKLRPSDAVGWTRADGGVRFAAIWTEAADAAERRIDWDLSEAAVIEAERTMGQRKLDPQSIAVWTGEKGEARYSVVWAPLAESAEEGANSESAPASILLDATEAELQARLNEQSSWAMGLGVAPASPSRFSDPKRVFQNMRGFPDQGRVYAGIWRGRADIEAQTIRGVSPEAALANARTLTAEGWRPVSTALTVQGSEATVAQVWHRPVIADSERLSLALRQSRTAATLARLGRPDRVWPSLKGSPDPTLRSQIIADWARRNADPKLLAERLRVESDGSARQALILMLGEYDPQALSVSRGESGLDSWLLAQYTADPHPGVHSAIDWLLRTRWGMGKTLDEINKSLASRWESSDRDWLVNRQGQTYAVVRGPIAFWMGSRLSDEGRRPEENRHLRRIDRSFAIATREVTVREYGRFLKENPDVTDFRNNKTVKSYLPSDDCPMTAVDWHDAARYCNWLSKQEGLPESEWCYPPEIRLKETKSKPLTLDADLLNRRGYRLPTEAEWECAARFGAETLWAHGLNPKLLVRQGWFMENAKNQAHPASSLHPNLLGMFDMAGNALERVYDGFKTEYSTADLGDGSPDLHPLRQLKPDDTLAIRGGAFKSTALYLRPADRYWIRATFRNVDFGFRVARTCR